MKTVSIILPALNEAAAIGPVLKKIDDVLSRRKGSLVFELIVVDDGSSDETATIAGQHDARVVSHGANLGNGAAVKSGLRAAGGDLVILMDADGQHDPEDLLRIVDELESFHMVVGARTRGSGTGIHRGIANRAYNLLASYVTGKKILDLTSGLRGMRTKVAKRFIYLLPNTFSYPTTLTLAFMRTGHSVKYIPIKAAKRVGKSKIRIFRDGARFFLIIVRIATFFSPFKVFFPIAFASAILGIANYAYTFFTRHQFTTGSALLLMQAVIIFTLALVSEQIAQLRFDRSEDER